MQPRYHSKNSSEEYSSDEFVPIAQLASSRNLYSGKESQSLFKRSVSDDVSNGSFVSGKTKSYICSNEYRNVDEFDQREEISLSSLTEDFLKHSEAKFKPLTEKAKVVSMRKEKTNTKKRKKSSVDRKEIDSDVSLKHISSFVTPSSVLYSKSLKGQLIQSVLCRWWYAYTWPDPDSIPNTSPSNCDSLDGFPGVYIHTSGPNVGKIIDYRDKSTCPNFTNFARKTSAELRDMLLRAVQKQRSMLIQIEGEGSVWLNELDYLEKWAKRLNDVKADREATMLLKAECLSL